MDNSVISKNNEFQSSTAELLESNKLDTVSFAYLGIILFTYRIFTGFMQNFPKIVGNGAVINSLITSVLMIAVVKITMSLCRYTGSINLFELCGKYFGKFAKGLLGVIVVLFSFVSVINAVIDFSELSKIIAFKTAPLWFIILFFAGIIFMTQRVKIKSILGVFSVIVPIIIILLALLFITSFRYADVNNLFPVLGTGIDSTFFSGLKTISIYSDFILLLFTGTFFGSSDVKKATKAVEISALTGAMINVLAVLIFTLCAAYPFSKDIANPLYNVIEIVYYGRFFQRIDGFYMLVALLVGMLYIAHVSNIIISISGELFKIKNTKPLSVLYPVLIGVLSCVLNEKKLYDGLEFYIMNYSFLIGLILPCILMIIISLIYKSKKKKTKSENI